MAYLIIGGTIEDREEKIKEISQSPAFSFDQNNPDLLIIAPEKTIGIDQIRQIKAFLSKKSWRAKGKKTVIVNQAGAMTRDAQNAFLKTLEEPPKNSVIILAAGNKASLLETIVSRCQIIVLKTKTEPINKNLLKEWEKLISASLEKKLAFSQSKKEEEIKAWLEEAIISFQGQLAKEKSIKTARWLKLLLQAQKMINENIKPQRAIDWLVLKI